VDARCQSRAEVIEAWINEIDKAEEVFMNLEASEDALFGEIYLETKGTVDERKAKTNSDPRMKALRASIAEAKKNLGRAKRMHELALKAGDWEYGTLKTEEAVVRRQRA
jgi:hypothetical protein